MNDGTPPGAGTGRCNTFIDGVANAVSDLSKAVNQRWNQARLAFMAGEGVGRLNLGNTGQVRAVTARTATAAIFQFPQ